MFHYVLYVLVRINLFFDTGNKFLLSPFTNYPSDLWWLHALYFDNTQMFAILASIRLKSCFREKKTWLGRFHISVTFFLVSNRASSQPCGFMLLDVALRFLPRGIYPFSNIKIAVKLLPHQHQICVGESHVKIGRFRD